MDGTLLNGQHVLSELTLRALNNLRARNANGKLLVSQDLPLTWLVRIFPRHYDAIALSQ